MNGLSSDNELVTRAIRGDQRAFARLVERYAGGLMQTARTLGLPESDIEDAVQETFVAAWRNLGQYDPGRPFRGWLFRVGINKIRDIGRYRRVRRFLFGAGGLDDAEVQSLADEAPDPARQALATQQLKQVRAVLDGLDRDVREALVLTAFVGLTQPEAAVALGTSVKSVESRVARGRENLARLIK